MKNQKHLNKYFVKEKQILALKRKYDQIRDAINKQGYIELKKPIHDGYNAEYVLKDEILRRDDSYIFEEVLSVCKKRIWSRNKSFKFKNRYTKKWEVQLPDLKLIDGKTYEKLSRKAKEFFVEDFSLKRWSTTKYYKCTLSHQLKLRISKSYITHIQEHDNILYQMKSEVEKQLYDLTNDCPWGRDSHYSNAWYFKETCKEKTNAKKEMRKHLEDIF